MKSYIFFIFLIVSVASIACSTTGADKRLPVPVADVDSAENGVIVEDTASFSAEQKPRHDTITIAMTGDIMMGTTYPAVALPTNEGRGLFKDVASILQKADIAVGNLEGTLCDGGETTKKKGKYNYAFRTPVSFGARLREAGYDFLSMANNHAFDFGWQGVMSTEHALDSLGIRYAGIKGRTRAVIVKQGGVRYGFCAFGHNGYTLRHQDLDVVKETLDSLAVKADIVVVSFHGGAEGSDKSHLPQGKEMFLDEDRGSLRGFAHFCIDHGADIVYGHGPHVVRCVEVYKGRFIAYSLGNFCTPYGINVTGISGYAPVVEAKVATDGRFIEGKIHSFIQRRGVGPRLDKTNAVARQIRSLTLTDITKSSVVIANDGGIRLKDD